MTFADLGVCERVRAALASRGIDAPFPVQELVIPVALTDRDLLVRSPTGSGKTLAFGIPLMQQLPARGVPSGLVLAPTRELAAQIGQELEPMARARNLTVAVCYGGVGLEQQARRAARADLIVATPGRLLDHLQAGRLSLAAARRLVLDEADRMLDMGFLPQVGAILAALPDNRQTMLFSATLEGQVATLAARYTHDPELLRIDARPREEELAQALEHRFIACGRDTRGARLRELIDTTDDLVLVFCRTRRGADRLTRRLATQGVDAVAMHGNLTQNQRERALRRFGRGESRVLVATDVASRGIDLDGVGLVINFDAPEDRAAYTHRVGRTARAGRGGRAVSLVIPESAETMGRIAAQMGLLDGWAETGYAAPTVAEAPHRDSRGDRRRPGPQSRARRPGRPSGRTGHAGPVPAPDSER